MLALKPRLPRTGIQHQDSKGHYQASKHPRFLCNLGSSWPHKTTGYLPERVKSGSLTSCGFRTQLWGPFAGLLGPEEGQEEEGRAAAPSATRMGRGQPRSGGPRTGSASPSLPGLLRENSSGHRHSPAANSIPAQPARLPRRDAVASFAGSPRGDLSPAPPSRACPRRGCCAAPRPRRRACPPALTILQMEAMFLTVISLKVAAIPHRHLYKVKTAPLMVGRAQEGRGGGGGGFCSGAGIKARGGDCTGTL